MRSLLLSRPTLPVIQDREHNAMNGADAESYAMAKLVLACRGEGQWGSREEDNSKIDLILSCEHPWHRKERMLILVQVKSGSSYGEAKEQGFKLKSSAIAAAKRTSHGICLVWVDRERGGTYWAYVHPDTLVRTRVYGGHHNVSPATLYDLARCNASRRAGAKGGRGIIVRRRTSGVTERRRRQKESYRAVKHVNSPVMGRVEFTRLGWRHMFRASRRKVNKSTSLDLVPYLRRLIERFPSTHAITSIRAFATHEYQYRVCEHLLKYDEIMVSDRTSTSMDQVTAYVRLIEEIRYPIDWEFDVMRSQTVSRRVVLKSAYYKVLE